MFSLDFAKTNIARSKYGMKRSIFQTFWKTDSCTDSLLDYKIKKHQTGTLIKCLISMLSNIAETLQGYKKIMN